MNKYVIRLLSLFVFSVFPGFLFCQNVGIGTATPSEKLEVEGNLKVDTLKSNAILLAHNAGAGKILTSDDAGNATWENMSTPPGVSDNDNVGYGVWGDCATNGNISEYHPVADDAGIAGDGFGSSVSISGSYAVTGAFGDTDVEENQGSASIYQYSEGNWILMEKITDSFGLAGDFFGSSVSLSDNYVIVGAPSDDETITDQGSASIYLQDSNNWVFMEKLTDAGGEANDNFGTSVSLSDNYAIVGANYDYGPAGAFQGSVSIYQFDGVGWPLMEKITDASGSAGDWFGISVAVYGNYAIVGASQDDLGSGSSKGSASIYHYDGNTWQLIQKLTDPSGATFDNFGSSVSITDKYAIVGAYGDDVNGVLNQGSASIYSYNDTSCVLMKKITNAIGSEGDWFGSSVSISDNYAIIGAYGDNNAAGTASIYIRVGNSWQKLQLLSDPAGAPAEFFGKATAIDGQTKRFLTGSYGYSAFTGKVVFGKIN